jgi:hypothetical protein
MIGMRRAVAHAHLRPKGSTAKVPEVREATVAHLVVAMEVASQVILLRADLHSRDMVLLKASMVRVVLDTADLRVEVMASSSRVAMAHPLLHVTKRSDESC